MRILTTIHLNDIQKEVLAKTKAAPTPQVAFEEISGKPEQIDDNFAAAKDALVDMGLLTQSDDTLEVTERGIQVMKDENLIDDMGEFTEDGNELVGKERGREPSPEEIAGGPEGGAALGAAGPGAGQGAIGGEAGGFPMEGFELIRELQDRARILDLSTRR